MDAGYNLDKAKAGVQNFLSSNSLFAKIAFLLLVIILFVLLLRLGSGILAYIFEPQPNVILFNGMISGRKQKIISR